MGQKYYGSICMSDLINFVKKQHSAFNKADNGKIYANVNVWLNDEPDKFGNQMSIQLNPVKDKVESDGRPYFGNFKVSEKKPIDGSEMVDMQDALDEINLSTPIGKDKEDNDLPF